MATISKRLARTGKSRYRVQIRRIDYPAMSRTFSRKTDAERWARETEKQILADRNAGMIRPKRHTVAEMIDRYMERVLPMKRESTQVNQAQILAWWRKNIGRMKLDEVRPPIIAEMRDRLLRGYTPRHMHRSPATVVRYLAAISHCYTYAVREWGWADESPVRNVTKPKEPRGRVRYLSDDERERLLEACRASSHPYLYPIVLLAISTGMRHGEIMNLTWDRVDLNRERIILLSEHTKNATSRAVPLAGPALAQMRLLAASRISRTNLVFPGESRGGMPPRPIETRNAFRRACQSACITDFRFHDLRHTAASYLAMNGATPLDIAEVLGHKTLEMVKRYAHFSVDHLAGVVGRMNRAIFETPPSG